MILNLKLKIQVENPLNDIEIKSLRDYGLQNVRSRPILNFLICEDIWRLLLFFVIFIKME